MGGLPPALKARLSTPGFLRRTLPQPPSIPRLIRLSRFLCEEDQGQERILLVQILKCDLNYGYKLSQWAVLESLNGCEMRTLAQVPTPAPLTYTGQLIVTAN
jgi:hypothetical protein